ncbi:hypothetical protein BURPS1710b_3740 [Burkholderia pseudomallei 1710b]|uniref:Uncharacterized protein n=1 Tax=Burkholderia pseudomallei (strain 1710b) TaxID=320372 RepID=Q3JMV0_BURP1|nr:hypothetical protein BURPS1710b_3740 [Burkholderia pseudomallei 1710b]
MHIVLHLSYSEVFLQIHPAIHRRDPIAIAVEHQRLALRREEAVLADAPLGRLAPARMVDVRVDVRIEAVFVRRIRVPARRRLPVDEADLHDRFRALEAVLPRHDHPHGRAVLIGQHLPVDAYREQRQRIHRLVHPQAFRIRPVEDRRGQPRHLRRVRERDELHVLRVGGRLDALDELRQRKADPRNHHRPAFDAAQPVHALLERRELQQRVDVVHLRVPDFSFDRHAPRMRPQRAGTARGIALVGAEFVEVVIGRDVLERRHLLRDDELRIGRRRKLARRRIRRCVRGEREPVRADESARRGGARRLQDAAAMLEHRSRRDFAARDVVAGKRRAQRFLDQHVDAPFCRSGRPSGTLASRQPLDPVARRPFRQRSAERPAQEKTAEHAVRRRLLVVRETRILQLAVTVQAGQEHVDAEECERRDEQARQRPPCGDRAAQPFHQTHVQPRRIIQPHDERPGFLRVPAPVAAPRLGRPQRAEDRRDREECEADRDRFVHHVVEHLERRQAIGEYAALLRQIRNRDHRGQREAAVADEVRRHVDLHPPALQRGHERLDLLRVACDRVPHQEADRRADHEQHERAERARAVMPFVIQIEKRGDEAEQHEDFIQVRHRNVADVRADQV